MERKKNKKMLVIIIAIIFGICCVYYYYPRKVSFELYKEISKPTENFDNSQWLTYSYVQNEERLIYCLVDYYKQRCPPQQGYDSIFAHNLSKTLDYENYDYLIVYQKKLKDLTYSPYLANREDLLKELVKKPLIPTFDTVVTDKVYIYRIDKNNKYRAPGP